jgi:hypothetical protein
MNASMLAILNEPERQLAAETERDSLAALDEDTAIELETRVRRARNKYVGQYRRSAATRVGEHGGRGRARPENKRALLKAEAFERMLAQVSRRVAVLARQSAAGLRAERLAAARTEPDWPGTGQLVPRQRKAGPAADPQPTGERALRSPARERVRAGTQATTARKQARKDNR